MEWTVYVLRCADGTLYTGITNNLEKRLEGHNAGIAAKYTCGRRPVKVVYQEKSRDRAHALRREYAIKKLPRCDKEKLVGHET